MAIHSTDRGAAVSEQAGSNPRGWIRDSLWIAGKDMRASWLSYPTTLVMAGLFGFVGVAQFDNALTGDLGVFGNWLLDFYLLCIVSTFGTNLIFNRDYYSGRKMQGFDERLSFLKGLPVNPRSAITGRAICAVVAIIFAAPAFFVVPYLVNEALRDAIGVGGYIAFGFFWVGYALVITAVGYIYGAFGIRWKTENTNTYIVWFFMAIVAASFGFRLLFGDAISLTALRLAGDHGLVLATISLLVGITAMAFGIRKAESGLARRDIG